VVSFATLSGDWTFNDARYTNRIAPSDDPNGQAVVLSGLRVYNTAQYVGSAALDISPNTSANSPWTIRVSGNWVGPYSPFDEPGVVLGAYGLLHATASVRLGRAATLDMGARNVFDRAYPELVAGHIVAPGEPRSGYVAVRYTIL
jgi:outer membrane receptor protein involved in Fe transport